MRTRRTLYTAATDCLAVAFTVGAAWSRFLPGVVLGAIVLTTFYLLEDRR